MTDIEYQQFITPCKQMLQEGKTIEEILKYLRKETNSKVVSGAVLINGLNISSAETKRLIHFSEAWRDVKERDEKFHKDLFSALEELDKGK
ncbi:MAG TPA: hypothetical protein VK206_18490 [Anaerolineales bacterium]|nr:hypothetical protein [Anaerolineales bacterium]